jgi:multidrug resistance protein, MATE family
MTAELGSNNERYDFLPSFLRLAGINMLSNLTVPLAGLVDVAFLGHLADIRHLAGVAIATVVINYIYWTFGFLRMGTSGMTAQAVGSRDWEGMMLVGLRNSSLALGLGVTILILQHPIRELGFALLSAAPEVKSSGQLYYNALIWGAPATLINFVLLGWFLGRGHGRPVLLLSLIGNGANIGLDYLLIGRWGWESVGAGAATAISQYIMLGVGLILIFAEFRSSQVFSSRLFKRMLDSVALKATFSLNSDILIRTLVLISTFAVFTNLSSTFGTTVLAANTLLLQILTLAAYFIDGIAFATESFAGIFRGKGAIAKLLPLAWISGGMSLGLGLAIAIAVSLFPIPLFSLLTDHQEVINRASLYALWLLPVLGFGSIAFMLDGYFLGLTEGSILRRSAVIAALIGFVPLAVVAWRWQNTHLLWLALALFMLGRVITLTWEVPKTILTSSSLTHKHDLL